jgi:hypothetical protein
MSRAVAIIFGAKLCQQFLGGVRFRRNRQLDRRDWPSLRIHHHGGDGAPAGREFFVLDRHTTVRCGRPVPKERPVRRAKTSDPGERRELIRRATTCVRTKASIDFLRDVRNR